MPKHIRRLIALLAILAVLFIGGNIYFHPESFGVYGHYWAASVEEIAAANPAYLNSDSFSADYPKVYETCSTGIAQRRKWPG